MGKKLASLGLLLLFMLIPTGCWDVKDISNQAFITSIGLDAVSDPDLKGSQYEAKYKVTFEIINQAKLAGPPGEPATIIETVEAPSIGKAVEELQARISKQLTLSHLRVLLVGDKLAREKNFMDPASFFEKSTEVALRIQLMFVQDKEARDVLKIKPRLGKSMSDELVALTEIETNTSLAHENPFNNFLLDLRNTGGRALGSRVIVHKERQILIRNGSAIFNNWKLAGWLGCVETQDANWITQEAPAVVQGQTEDLFLTCRTEKVKTEIVPEIKQGKPAFKLNIEMTGKVMEEQGKFMDLTRPENMEKISQTISEVVKQSAARAISKSQVELGIDYLGLGQALKRRYPKEYEKMNWEKVYPGVPVEVNIKCTFGRSGLAR